METLSQTKEPMKTMPDAEGPMESKAKEIPTSIMEQENEKADNLTLQYNSYGSFIFSVSMNKCVCLHISLYVCFFLSAVY